MSQEGVAMDNSDKLDSLNLLKQVQRQDSEPEDLSVKLYGDPKDYAAKLVKPDRARVQGGNILFAVLGGAFAAAMGVIAWTYMSIKTGYQISWVAIVIGFIVGMAVRICGRGRTNGYGFLGAGFALVACLVGKILADRGVAVEADFDAFIKVMKTLDVKIITETLKQNFHPLDLLFYSVAILEGYKLSIKKS